MPVTHAFNSPKADGADATLVRPSNWNAAHTITGVVENVLFDAKGDILIATAADTPARLPVGANDTILMADSGVTEGLKWVASAAPAAETFGAAQAIGTTDTFARGDHVHAMPADPVTNHAAAADPHTGYVLETLFTAKGALITASAASTPSTLAVGADDTILMADAAAGGGLKWVASAAPAAESFGAAQAIGTADTFSRGDHVHAMPADPVTAHAGAGDPHTGYRLESADHTHATTGLQAGAVAHTVLTGLLNDEHTQYQKEADWTAKGDLMSASSGGVTARLPVGADDTILMADAAAAQGLKWAASAAPAAETFGAAQAIGTADTFARGDHVHAMPADPVTNHAAAGDPHTGYVLEATAGVTGTFALTGDITATSTGAQDNWAPTGIGTAAVIRWNGASAMTLSGITTGADGKVLVLLNVTAAQTITLVHDLTSTAANRFYLPASTNLDIGPNTGALLVYDSTSSRWRLMASVGGGAGSPTGVYAASVGDGSTTSFALSHGLNTSDVQVFVYDNSTKLQIAPDVAITSTSQVTVSFDVAPTSNQYRVVITGGGPLTTGSLTVEEENVSIVTPVQTINFKGSDFNVSAPGGTQVDVALAEAIPESGIGAPMRLLVRKGADEPITNNTLQPDNDLLVPVLANEVWRFEWHLLITGSSSADMTLRFTFPSGGVLSCTFAYNLSNDTYRWCNLSATTSPTGTLDFPVMSTTIPHLLAMPMTFVTGGTPGNVVLEWAQFQTSGTPTTIKLNSTIWGCQVA